MFLHRGKVRRYLKRWIEENLLELTGNFSSNSARMHTDFQFFVHKFICDGCSNREIGVVLQIAETTARDHVNSVIRKSSARDKSAYDAKCFRLQVLN